MIAAAVHLRAISTANDFQPYVMSVHFMALFFPFFVCLLTSLATEIPMYNSMFLNTAFIIVCPLPLSLAF